MEGDEVEDKYRLVRFVEKTEGKRILAKSLPASFKGRSTAPRFLTRHQSSAIMRSLGKRLQEVFNQGGKNMAERILFTVIATVAILVGACAPAAAPAPSAPKAAEPQKAAEAKPAQTKPTGPPVTLHYGRAFPTAETLPAYAAIAKGFFKEENIDLDIVYISTGDKMISALVGGSLDIANYTPDWMIRAVEKGEKLAIVLGGWNVPIYSLVTPKAVRTYSDLKGKRFAVSALKSSDAYFARKMLAANGLKESTDYDLIQVGGTPERVAALKSGSVGAALLLPPQDQQAVDEGYNRLDTTTQVVKSYAWAAHAAKKEWAEKNEQTIIGLARAWIKGTRWVYDPKNKNEAVAILQQHVKLEDKYAISVYETYVNAASWDKDGAISVPGLQAVIDAMGEMGDMTPPLPKVEKFIDTSYWQKAIKTLQ